MFKEPLHRAVERLEGPKSEAQTRKMRVRYRKSPDGINVRLEHADELELADLDGSTRTSPGGGTECGE